jgi:hypothetical protein
MTKRGLTVGSIILGVLLPSSAGAQEWLKDRRYTEGAGIRTGDLELHPGIAGEVGYDSNWFYRSPANNPQYVNAAPNAPVLGAGVLRVTPSLYVSTLGAQRRENEATPTEPSMRFRAGVSGTYREFLFGDDLIKKQRNVSIGADARLDILPGRPWGGAIFGNYSRFIQPTVIGDPNLSFNRDDVGGGAEIIAQPGGGTLDWHFGYQLRASLYEDSEGTPFNNITHEAFTKGRWKFRPQTALVYDATLRFISYTNNAPGGLQNSTPVRTRMGLNGLITPRFSVLVLAGYGGSFYSTTAIPKLSQYDSVIGQVEAKWYISANPGSDEAPQNVSLTLSSISLGYLRDFQNSLLGNYYGLDRGYAKASFFFAGRVLVSLEGGVGAIEYPTIFDNAGAQRAKPFTDIRADATLYGEYRLTDSFALNATGRYVQNFSNTQLPVATTSGPNLYDMSWQRIEAYAGVRWFL